MHISTSTTPAAAISQEVAQELLEAVHNARNLFAMVHGVLPRIVRDGCGGMSMYDMAKSHDDIFAAAIALVEG